MLDSRRAYAISLFVLASILLFGLWRLLSLRFGAGDIYPAYSSLRADQQGTRALFESIRALPGYTAVRHIHPLDKLSKGAETVFYLGVDPRAFAFLPDAELIKFESLAASGVRLVIGFERTGPPKARKTRNQTHEESSVAARWGIAFDYLKSQGDLPASVTSLILRPHDAAWHGIPSGSVPAYWMMERAFGKGSIVLVAQSYPLSNEGLQRDRKTVVLAWLIGPNRRVVFDESHLGVVSTGSISMLARKYRLEPLVAVLLALGGLFVWKNSSSLAKRVDTGPESGTVAAQDASAGLANLLRRNIRPAGLLEACVGEWAQDQARGHFTAQQIARVKEAASRPGDPVARYREIARILAGEKA